MQVTPQLVGSPFRSSDDEMNAVPCNRIFATEQQVTPPINSAPARRPAPFWPYTIQVIEVSPPQRLLQLYVRLQERSEFLLVKTLYCVNSNSPLGDEVFALLADRGVFQCGFVG